MTVGQALTNCLFCVFKPRIDMKLREEGLFELREEGLFELCDEFSTIIYEGGHI